MHCTTCTRTPHLDRILARQRRILVTDFLLWALLGVGLLAAALAG
jgi:hypothetical protein